MQDALEVLGVSGLVLGELPSPWPRRWRQKHYLPFAKWPSGQQESEQNCVPQLLDQFREALIVFDVPFGIGGFELKDVHTFTTKRLSFARNTGSTTIMFNGATDAVVIPFGSIPWQGQTRILFVWNRPSDLQSVESVVTQAQLELMEAFYTSRYPALVVVTDGVYFVVLQSWGETIIHYFHTFPEIGGSVLADDAMRLIAYHLG